MVAPEVQPRVVLGDLIADLVAPLLTVALQLLSVLNASRTIIGQILGTPRLPHREQRRANAGSNARSGSARCRTRSGRKLCRCGPATALQELGCGAAGAWPGSATCPHSAGRSTRDIQEVVHLAGRRPGAGDASAGRASLPPPPAGCALPHRASRRPSCGARAARAAGCRARGRAAGVPPLLHRRPLQANGRPRPPPPPPARRPAATSATATAATSTTASKDVVLHEKKDRSDEYQESHYTFHVVTCDLF